MRSGGHPVRRQLDFRQRRHRRRREIGDGFADRHARRSGSIDQGQRRAFAHRHRFAGDAEEVGQGDGAIGQRQLPRPDHLVARAQAADGAVADGDEEILRGDGRVREHAQPRFAQIHRLGVQARPTRRRRALRIAMHLRRLAEQHVHRHVYGTLAIRHPQYQALLGRGDADRSEGTTLARADRLELGEVFGRHAEHVALLRLVAPQLHRRQRGIVAGNLRQFDHAAHVGIVQQFGNRVRQSAGADVVHESDRVGVAEGDAAVDHFLAAPFHLRVVALHRGEIEIFRTLAGTHRRSGTAAEADQHRRAAEHDHHIARPQRELLHQAAIDRADAAREHDGLVVGAHEARRFGRQFETAEIAGEVRSAEFVVERGAAERTVEHDLERARHARIQRAIRFPGLGQGRDAQMRDRETGQARLRLAATSGRALVANFAAGAGAGAGKRRDRRRMVMRFDLDAEGAVERRGKREFGAVRIGTQATAAETFHHRRIVFVRAQRELWRLRMRVLDHPEQRRVLFLAIDRPRRVEDLVPAMFRVGLREHHQFGVAGVATEFAVTRFQVLDFVRAQGQAEARIGFAQRRQRDPLQRAGRLAAEQASGVLAPRQQGLRHRIVQRARQRSRARICIGRQAGDIDTHAAFDPLHRVTGPTQDFGRLARPGRKCAQTRRHVARLRAVCRRLVGDTAFQDAANRGEVGRGASVGFDEIDVPGAGHGDFGNEAAQAGLKAFAPERRQGRQALKDDHIRGFPGEMSAIV